ncbi:hypothetical protein TWF696_003020 [Orbilia brochopaga]|uniref:tRNA(Ile)-lysidine synthetase n=1 Tax=Orbilia brochopaga TaxID=3140254 RepID=A0AAV9TZE3_9PEZI
MMAAKRMLHAAKGVAAVSPAEFATFLGAAVTAGAALRNVRRTVPERIALGVSGGVDSMALALLASKLAGFENEFSKTQFVAVVIDHGLREGSADEADGVEATVERLGLRPHRLSFNWVLEDEAAKGIESIARRRRYRAFVDGCNDFDISHLVTAHHGNDQAETVLMRLLAESGVAGLAGIRPAAPVPECGDVFGAEKITLLRPFLSVLKSRLRKTLEEDKITWFEDPTNHDPKLTTRNAIRALLTAPSATPPALQPAALITLSNRIAAQNDQLADTVDWFLARCFCRHVRESGMIECFIPYNLLRFPPEFLARVVARLAAVITPLDRIDMTQMARVVQNILYTRNAQGAPAKLLGRTAVEPDGWQPPQDGEAGPEKEIKRRKATKRRDFRATVDSPQYAGGAITENNVFWEAAYCPAISGRPEGVMLRCHRQPYIRSSLKQVHNTPQIELTRETAGKWHLWDGRFWIRFAGGEDHEFWRLKERQARGILLTGTRKEVMYKFAELGFLGDVESKRKVRELGRRLKTDAPGKARTVLPVVCEVTTQNVKRWMEPLGVVAFPTFGVQSGEGRGGEWEWRPKRDLVVAGQVIGRIPVMVADRQTQAL